MCRSLHPHSEAPPPESPVCKEKLRRFSDHRISRYIDYGVKVKDSTFCKLLVRSKATIVTMAIAYHRGFDGRVAQIEGLEGLSLNSTVAELRKTVNTGQIPLTSGSPTICNALNYMCNLYKVDFRGDEIASDGQ